jgi:3-phosphoshikimate 1-carboxyvinyltransferase
MSSGLPNYPEKLEIKPLTKPPHATVNVPGSKSITNRALVLAALANAGDGCTLHGALRSEDTEIMIACLRRLGFQIKEEWGNSKLWVGHLSPHRIPANNADLFVGNSGTTMRFLTAMVGLGQGQYRLDGIPRMRERPIEDLLIALRQLGVDARSELGNGCPPVIVQANGLDGGYVQIRGNTSSQFLSALMMVAPFARGPIYLKLAGSLVSEPYVEMTRRMVTEWGATVRQPLPDVFHIEPGLQREVQRYAIEPDASAASYFLAAASIAGGDVCVAGLDRESLQGDVRFIEVLEQMGCRWIPSAVGLDLESGPLHGIDADMDDISDTVMTLAAVACFAEGPTTIRNVAHIRHKETDRLAALAAELRRVGAEVDEFADGLTITPRPLHGAEIETYNDHRMAMSMALIGLKVPGVVIKNPGCVAKTYPHFFDDLERLR